METERIYRELQAAQRRGDLPERFADILPAPKPRDIFDEHARICRAMRRKSLVLLASGVEELERQVHVFTFRMELLTDSITDSEENTA